MDKQFVTMGGNEAAAMKAMEYLVGDLTEASHAGTETA